MKTPVTRISTRPLRLRGYEEFPFLGRSVAGAAVAVPAVELAQGELRYSDQAQVRAIETEGLLDAFLTLTIQPESDNSDVLQFARVYGPLWLCDLHSLVSYHRPVPLMGSPAGPGSAKDEMIRFDASSLYCLPKLDRHKPRIFSERVSEWRRLAQEAHDLLQITAGLRERAKHRDPVEAAVSVGKYCESIAETWKGLDGIDLNDPAYKAGSHWAYLADPWQRVTEDLNRWLLTADVQVFVTPASRDFQLRLGSNRFFWSVLSPIALEIVIAVCRAAGIGICAGCGHPYLLRREPIPGKRNFCDRCKKAGVPSKLSARDWRVAHRRK